MKLRTKTYSTTDPSVTPRELENRSVARRAAAEGMVLLKNEGGTLPISPGSRIALYGAGAKYAFKGGTGSGDVNERERVTIAQGLENAGFRITTRRWLEDYDRTYDRARTAWRDDLMARFQASGAEHLFFIYASNPFLTPDSRPIDEEDVAESDTDTAIYVLSRLAGEGADRFARSGDYYLSDSQRSDLQFLSNHYAKVILIINAGSQVDLSFLEDMPAIRSVIYMVQAGMEGGNALADLISGAVTPSGKLADTWAKRYEDYPASSTFSHNDGQVDAERYEEGIYVGYRWFDSFEVEPLFPFGFGLSYTTFDLSPAALSVDPEGRSVSVSLSVTNTGTTYSGKEVVQVYAACPQEGLPKERQRLCAFAKTGLLAPGQSQELKLTFPVKALASFDEGKNAWVTEKGLYGIFVGTSSRSLTLSGALEISRDTVVEQVGPICPLREDLVEKVRPSDKAFAFAEAWHQELSVKNLPILPLCPALLTPPIPRRTQVMADASALAARLTDDELIHMVVGEISRGQDSALGAAGVTVPGAAGETSSILEKTYGVPGLPMADGPAGVRLRQSYQVSKTTGCLIPGQPLAAFEGGLFGGDEPDPDAVTHYQFCTAFPVGTLLAQSWDTQLMEEVGQAVGRELEEFGVTWWLAPGMNIHRDPLCGRNFEYYSEDPTLTGRMAAAITRGVQSLGGIGTTIKHFACNNQEDNRMGSDSILSQRALREIYLRGFEIAVRSAQPMAIMTSYNRINGVFSANNYDLCTRAAREEWGFEGIIMTDWTTTSPRGGATAWRCAAAGNDLIMPGTQGDLDNIAAALERGELDRETLRACAARLIAMAYQSNCYEQPQSYLSRFEGRLEA